MASFYPCVKNHASGYIFYISLVSQASTKLFQSNPTIAAGDFKVSIDGGTLNNLGTLPTVTPASSKMVKITLSQAETNGDNITVVCSDAAGAEWCDLTVNIQTVPRRFDDLAYPATSGRSMVVDAAGLVDANVVKVGPTGSGTAQTAGDIIGDTNDIQARLPAALVSGKIDASIGAYASGQDPATLILVTPANKLATNASGYVTEVSVDGIQKNTALNNFEFPMFDSADHITLKTGLTITAQRSIDGVAFAACANSASEVGTTGVYKINLANTDLNGDVITFLFTATGADARLITIKTNS